MCVLTRVVLGSPIFRNTHASDSQSDSQSVASIWKSAVFVQRPISKDIYCWLQMMNIWLQDLWHEIVEFYLFWSCVCVCVCLPGLPECNGSRALDCFDIWLPSLASRQSLSSRWSYSIFKQTVNGSKLIFVRPFFTSTENTSRSPYGSNFVFIGSWKESPGAHFHRLGIEIQRGQKIAAFNWMSLLSMRPLSCGWWMDYDGFATDTVNQYQSLSI